jgi:hypothetical protein
MLLSGRARGRGSSCEFVEFENGVDMVGVRCGKPESTAKNNEGESYLLNSSGMLFVSPYDSMPT